MIARFSADVEKLLALSVVVLVEGLVGGASPLSNLAPSYAVVTETGYRLATLTP